MTSSSSNAISPVCYQRAGRLLVHSARLSGASVSVMQQLEALIFSISHISILLRAKGPFNVRPRCSGPLRQLRSRPLPLLLTTAMVGADTAAMQPRLTLMSLSERERERENEGE